MKKLFYFAAVAALVLTSCAKTVDTHKYTGAGDAVSFGVYAGKAADTKAVSQTDHTTITTTALQNSTFGFGVFGYYTDNANYTSGSYYANFMYNQQVKYNTGNWEYSPIKYWPNEHGTNAHSTGVDKLTFMAYAPYVANATINNGSNSTVSDGSSGVADEGIIGMTGNAVQADATLTFKVPASSEEQIDLLYGRLKTQSVNVDGTSEPAVAPAAPEYSAIENLTKEKTGGKVNIIFRHALAKIAINIKEVVDAVTPETSVNPSEESDPNWTKVVVKSLTLKGTNLGTQGTLNLYTGVWNVTTPATSFVVDPLPTDIAVASAPTAYPSTLAGVDEDGLDNTIDLMLIPHYSDNSTPADATDDVFTELTGVEIVYYVCTKDDNLAIGASIVENSIDKNFAEAIKIKKGMQYNLTVLLGLTSVKLDASVQDWDTDLNGNSNLTDDDLSIDLPQNVA